VSDNAAFPPGKAPAMPVSPGEQLRAARERVGWTVEDLSAELSLPVERMRALERDDHVSFGGAVFVRGYLRRAAMLLGISPQELMAAYEVCCHGARPAEIVPGLPPGQPPRRGPPGWLGPLAGTVAVVAVIASTWWILGPTEEGAATAGSARPAATPVLEFTMPEEPREALAETVPEPVDTTPEVGDVVTVEAPRPEVSVVETQAPPTPPPGTVELRFEFSEDCWLEVIDAEERQLAYRLHRAGDVTRLRGTAPVSVFLGNAEGVRLTVDGTEVPLRTARRDGTARLTVGGGAG
jgi:cytoskeleton protein RodZ